MKYWWKSESKRPTAINRLKKCVWGKLEWRKEELKIKESIGNMTFLGGFKGKGWKQDLNFFRKFSATARYYRVLADVETKTEAILSPFNIWEKLRKTVFVFHENRWSFVAKKATKKAQILTKNGLKVYGFALLSCDVMRRRPFVCEYLSCTKLGQEPTGVRQCSAL